MKIHFASHETAPDSVLVYGLAKGGAVNSLHGLPETETIMLAALAKAQAFTGDAGAHISHYILNGDAVQRVVLLGLGDQSPSDCEKAGAALAALLLTHVKTMTLNLTGIQLSTEARNRLLAGLVLRSWRYDLYHTKLKEADKTKLEDITIVGAPDTAQAEWQTAEAVTQGVAFTRMLVTEPANIIYPESFVERAQALTALGVTIKVLDVAEMTKLGMGALLGVAQGSARPPRLLVMEYDGSNGTQAKPIAFVGKGVTFDTGGISLKPANGMEDMKWDMGGAGAVTGAMMALAGRKAKVHVVGVCALVENMPDGNAQRPGDVVTSMSGQTIEVINTDAEGRLVLCDALTWVQQTYHPEVVVNLATLTGAIIGSLGHEYAGLFSNDDGLAAQLTAAGAAAGDPLWRMPLGAAYDKLIDSAIADISNIGPSGKGGSITAAQFLQRFIQEGVKWAHLDIAGMVWAAKPGAVWDKGATGYGVRLLDRFIADYFEG